MVMSSKSHSQAKFLNSSQSNCGPLSLINWSGMPCLAKWGFSLFITLVEDTILIKLKVHHLPFVLSWKSQYYYYQRQKSLNSEYFWVYLGLSNKTTLVGSQAVCTFAYSFLIQIHNILILLNKSWLGPDLNHVGFILQEWVQKWFSCHSSKSTPQSIINEHS